MLLAQQVGVPLGDIGALNSVNVVIAACIGQAFLGESTTLLHALGVALAVAGGVVQSALFNVDGGHRAVIFDRFQGIKQTVIGEGTHFMIPWVQRPIMFDIR